MHRKRVQCDLDVRQAVTCEAGRSVRTTAGTAWSGEQATNITLSATIQLAGTTVLQDTLGGMHRPCYIFETAVIAPARFSAPLPTSKELGRLPQRPMRSC